jgi:hypothetical protein
VRWADVGDHRRAQHTRDAQELRQAAYHFARNDMMDDPYRIPKSGREVRQKTATSMILRKQITRFDDDRLEEKRHAGSDQRLAWGGPLGVIAQLQILKDSCPIRLC